MVLAPEEVVVEKDRLKGILASGGIESSLLAMHLAEIQESAGTVLEYVTSLKEDGKQRQQIRDILIDLTLSLDHLVHHSEDALALLEPELGLEDVVTLEPVHAIREEAEEYSADEEEQ